MGGPRLAQGPFLGLFEGSDVGSGVIWGLFERSWAGLGTILNLFEGFEARGGHINHMCRHERKQKRRKGCFFQSEVQICKKGVLFALIS